MRCWENGSCCPVVLTLRPLLFRFEAIATGLEPSAIRLEAIAIRVEAIAIRDAIAIRSEARVEATATMLAIAI